MASRNANRVRYIFIAGLSIIIILFVVVIWLGATRGQEEIKDITVIIDKPLPGSIFPKAIKVEDGLQTRWFPNVKRRADLNKAASGSYNIIDVTLNDPDQGDDGIKLYDLWSTLNTNNIGVKINVKTNEEAEMVVNDLKNSNTDQPTIISVPVLAPEISFNLSRFEEIIANAVSSRPVPLNCCDSSGLGHGSVEYLGFLLQNINFSTSVEMHVDLIQPSWTDMKWLLDTNPNLQLILSAEEGYNATKYDLLLVRNDIDGDRIFYNIDGELFNKFLDLASTAGSPLLYFDISPRDASDVIWSHNTDTWKLLNAATKGSYNIIDVTLNDPDQGDDGIKLYDLWSTLNTNNIGVKINVKTNEEAEMVVNDLKNSNTDQPTIISVPVLAPEISFNLSRFEEIIANAVSSRPVPLNCCDSSGLGHGSVEYLGFLLQNINFSTSVEMHVDLIQPSWTDMKWLLDTNPNLQLILSAEEGYNATKYDLLLVRNDIDGDRIFYNIDGELFNKFLDLASTAGSPLLYFDISPRDASDVIWSHNTDTWKLLNAATKGDIMLLGQDTPNQTNLPIMAHDIGDYNNLTFEQWLDEIIKVEKGMKLDFKTLDGVKPALEIVSRKKSLIKGPVWANADILKGPDSADPRIPASDFLKAVETFPNVVLSLGWKTIRKGEKYNLNYKMDMVKEMYETIKDVKLPITFPVRAEQLVDSWSSFEWLLAQSRGYTLTVWTAYHDNVTKSDMDFIRRKSEAARVYFDLPDDLRPTII